MVADIFVEGQRADQHPARGVGHPDHIEIALQASVLARRTVYRDVREVEMPLLVSLLETEIVLIDGRMFPVGEHDRPFAFLDDGDIYIIFILIDKGVESFRAF